jgi:hypothetical protein
MYPGPPQPQPQPSPPPHGPPGRPSWARKRILLPGLFLTWFFGFALGTTGASGSAPGDEAAASATPRPTATVTATATETAETDAEPAPTVTVTKKVKVRTTVTVTAKPPAGGGSGSGSDSGGSGPAYYGNCSEARAAGAAPVHRGEPGYGRHLDRDGDGVGCDS